MDNNKKPSEPLEPERWTLKEGEHDEESVSCSDSGSEHPDPCTGCHFIKEINMDAAAIKIAIKL